ncbi:hypothetical protein ACGF0D_31575 [Kitasatospora sp. NPDC048298]|uniref:hypothetical protein n=1 Tax=Kitasatospora sp. NPDC048298 TaxID=3364049 RepID=UPI0037117D6C
MTIDQGAVRAGSGVIGGSGLYAPLDHVTEPRVTHAEAPEVFAGNVDRLRAVLFKALESPPAERDRVCSHALDGVSTGLPGVRRGLPDGVPRPAATVQVLMATVQVPTATGSSARRHSSMPSLSRTARRPRAVSRRTAS